MQPDAVAAAMLRAEQTATDTIYVSGKWRLVMAVIRALPERQFKRMKI